MTSACRSAAFHSINSPPAKNVMARIMFISGIIITVSRVSKGIYCVRDEMRLMMREIVCAECSEFADNEAGVMAAKPERITKSDVDLCLTGLQRNIIHL